MWIEGANGGVPRSGSTAMISVTDRERMPAPEHHAPSLMQNAPDPVYIGNGIYF
jgi:hypothetical protein